MRDTYYGQDGKPKKFPILKGEKLRKALRKHELTEPKLSRMLHENKYLNGIANRFAELSKDPLKYWGDIFNQKINFLVERDKNQVFQINKLKEENAKLKERNKSLEERIKKEIGDYTKLILEPRKEN